VHIGGNSETSEGPSSMLCRDMYLKDEKVLYTSSNGNVEIATVLKVHLDDSTVPFYDIQLHVSEKIKQTDGAHLGPLQKKRKTKVKSADKAMRRSSTSSVPKSSKGYPSLTLDPSKTRKPDAATKRHISSGVTRGKSVPTNRVLSRAEDGARKSTESSKRPKSAPNLDIDNLMPPRPTKPEAVNKERSGVSLSLSPHLGKSSSKEKALRSPQKSKSNMGAVPKKARSVDRSAKMMKTRSSGEILSQLHSVANSTQHSFGAQNSANRRSHFRRTQSVDNSGLVRSLSARHVRPKARRNEGLGSPQHSQSSLQRTLKKVPSLPAPPSEVKKSIFGNLVKRKDSSRQQAAGKNVEIVV